MEAFDETILPRAAWIDVDCLDLFSLNHCWTACAMNSGPLSERRCSGAPCSSMAFWSQANTSSARSARSARRTWHSRYVVQDRQHPQRTATDVASAMSPKSRRDRDAWLELATRSRRRDAPACAGRWHPQALSPTQSLHLSLAHGQPLGATTPRSADTVAGCSSDKSRNRFCSCCSAVESGRPRYHR